MGSFLPREQNARAWTHSIHSRHRTTSSFYMLVLIHILWNWCFVPLEVHCSIRPQQPRLIIFIGQKLTAVKLTSRTFSHTDEKLRDKTKQTKMLTRTNEQPKIWTQQTASLCQSISFAAGNSPHFKVYRHQVARLFCFIFLSSSSP